MPTSTLLATLSFTQNFSELFYNFVSSNIFIIKAIFIFVSVIFILLVFYFNTFLNISREKMEHWFEVIGAEKLNKRRALKAWSQIKRRMAVGGQSNMKLAILEADRVLDKMLRTYGYRGDNMYDRLNHLSSQDLLDVESIRHAHKLQAKIVSDPSFTLSKEEAGKAINIYGNALVDLGLLKSIEARRGKR